eukprot:14784028-Alexandrium_andersonii.AAC.1
MSASLVGSEMCIRDSVSSFSLADKSVKAYWLVGPCSLLSSMGAPGAREAVSYTHLTLPTICSV